MYIYVYNKRYFCLFKISTLVYLKLINNKCIEFSNYKKNNLNNLLPQQLSNYIIQFDKLNFTKIKFAGKVYKIKKNSQHSLILLFNRAHITVFGWKNIILKKLKKYKIYLKYNMLNKCVIKTIQNIRPINIFTKKGLRKSRQIILKKKGKK